MSAGHAALLEVNHHLFFVIATLKRKTLLDQKHVQNSDDLVTDARSTTKETLSEQSA